MLSLDASENDEKNNSTPKHYDDTTGESYSTSFARYTERRENAPKDARDLICQRTRPTDVRVTLTMKTRALEGPDDSGISKKMTSAEAKARCKGMLVTIKALAIKEIDDALVKHFKIKNFKSATACMSTLDGYLRKHYGSDEDEGSYADMLYAWKFKYRLCYMYMMTESVMEEAARLNSAGLIENVFGKTGQIEFDGEEVDADF